MGCFNSKPDCPRTAKGCKDNMVVFVPFSERDKFLEKDGSKAVLVYRMIRAAKPPAQPPPCSPKKPPSAAQKGPPPKKAAQECCPRPCCTDRRRKPSRGGDCCQRYRPCCCSPHDKGGIHKADSESHIKEAQTQASCKARVTYFCGSSDDVLQMDKAHHKKGNEIETQTRCQPKVVFVCKSYNGSSTDMDQNQDIVEYIDAPSTRRLQ